MLTTELIDENPRNSLEKSNPNLLEFGREWAHRFSLLAIGVHSSLLTMVI